MAESVSMTVNIGNLLTRRANINANIEALYDVAAVIASYAYVAICF